MANPGFNTVVSGSDAVEQNLTHAADGEGLPQAEGQAATTEHVAAGGHHAEPSIAGVFDATVIVSIAMIVFVAIVLVKGGVRAVTGGLDKQIAAIRQRLDEAKQLRADAEALRDEYLRKLGDVENQTKAIVAHAEDEAKAIVAKAEVDAADLVQRRARMAEDKIAAAERTALAEVRAKAADAATKAAASLIVARHGAEADKSLVDRAISGLARPN